MTVSEIIHNYRGDRSYRKMASDLQQLGFPISHAALRDWEAGEYLPMRKTLMLMRIVPELKPLAEKLEIEICFVDGVSPPVKG